MKRRPALSHDEQPHTDARVPRFSMFPVVIVGILLYVLLTIFLMVFICWKDAGLQAMFASGNVNLTTQSVELSLRSFLSFTMHLPPAVSLFVKFARWISVLSLLAILLGHVPLHILLRLRRKGREVPERLQVRVENPWTRGNGQRRGERTALLPVSNGHIIEEKRIAIQYSILLPVLVSTAYHEGERS